MMNHIGPPGFEERCSDLFTTLLDDELPSDYEEQFGAFVKALRSMRYEPNLAPFVNTVPEEQREVKLWQWIRERRDFFEEALAYLLSDYCPYIFRYVFLEQRFIWLQRRYPGRFGPNESFRYTWHRLFGVDYDEIELASRYYHYLLDPEEGDLRPIDNYRPDEGAPLSLWLANNLVWRLKTWGQKVRGENKTISLIKKNKQGEDVQIEVKDPNAEEAVAEHGLQPIGTAIIELLRFAGFSDFEVDLFFGTYVERLPMESLLSLLRAKHPEHIDGALKHRKYLQEAKRQLSIKFYQYVYRERKYRARRTAAAYPILEIDVLSRPVGEIVHHTIVIGGIVGRGDEEEGRWKVLHVSCAAALPEARWRKVFAALTERLDLDQVRLVVAQDFNGLRGALDVLFESDRRPGRQYPLSRLQHGIWAQAEQDHALVKHTLNHIFDVWGENVSPDRTTKALLTARRQQASRDVMQLIEALGDRCPEALAGLMEKIADTMTFLAYVNPMERRKVQSMQARVRDTWTHHTLPGSNPNLREPYREDYQDFLTWKLRDVAFDEAESFLEAVKAWAVGFEWYSLVEKQKYYNYAAQTTWTLQKEDADDGNL